jgi:hypothetical protein
MLTIDVVLRAIVIGEQVEAKELVLVTDDNLPRTQRRALITNNDYAWLDGLEIDQEYKLTLEPK